MIRLRCFHSLPNFLSAAILVFAYFDNILHLINYFHYSTVSYPHHEIAEILLKLACNTNQSINQSILFDIRGCKWLNELGSCRGPEWLNELHSCRGPK